VWVRRAADAIQKTFSGKALCTFEPARATGPAIQFYTGTTHKLVCNISEQSYTAEAKAYLGRLGFRPVPNFDVCFEKVYFEAVTNFEEPANLVLDIFDRIFGINKSVLIDISSEAIDISVDDPAS
jgi:hypothetical protein